MADKKPLRISDDANDLNPEEFGAADTVGIEDGGTSATTANDALNNLLPGQAGNNDKFLKTDGSNTSWAEVPSGGGGYIKFGSNASSGAGKWLEIHRNIVSNEVPYNVPQAIKLIALTATLKNSSTVTFGVYKNGTQIETLTLTASKKGIKTGLTHSLLANDEISVKINSGSASDPVFHVILG